MLEGLTVENYRQLTVFFFICMLIACALSCYLIRRNGRLRQFYQAKLHCSQFERNSLADRVGVLENDNLVLATNSIRVKNDAEESAAQSVNKIASLQKDLKRETDICKRVSSASAREQTKNATLNKQLKTQGTDMKALEKRIEQLAKEAAKLLNQNEELKAEVKQLKGDLDDMDDGFQDGADSRWKTRAVNLKRQLDMLDKKTLKQVKTEFNSYIDDGKWEGRNTPAHKVKV